MLELVRAKQPSRCEDLAAFCSVLWSGVQEFAAEFAAKFGAVDGSRCSVLKRIGVHCGVAKSVLCGIPEAATCIWPSAYPPYL